MKLSEETKVNIFKRLPAIILTVVFSALFWLYYLGFYDVSFIERPEAWKNNFQYTNKIFSEKKSAKKEKKEPITENKTQTDTEDDNTETINNKKEKTERNIELLTFKTVKELSEAGYKISNKVYDSSCVFGKLECDYKWPFLFTYTKKTADTEKITKYDDGEGKEATRETVTETVDRKALELYMGYILYDDRGVLYILGPDGSVLRQYNDSEIAPAYTRDVSGRPLFYKKTKTGLKYPSKQTAKDQNGNTQWLETKTFDVDTKEYFYLSEDGQTFIHSDYNDATDNRGLYFDYPDYYGLSDTSLKRYYYNTTAIVSGKEEKPDLLNRVRWMYSDNYVDIKSFKFSLDGKNLSNPQGKNLSATFPYSMAYNFRENYATVIKQIDWSYYHNKKQPNGTTLYEKVDVHDDELRVIDRSGKVMFDSRKNYISELGWPANERYVAPLSKGKSSLGSFYFDHGLLRIRIQSHDTYYFTEQNRIYIVTDDDVLVYPNGKKFSIPTGFKLVTYSDGILLLEKNGKYMYYSHNGLWISDKKYDDASPFIEGVAVCKRGGYYGAIDTKGNIVIPFEYDYLSDISSGNMAAYKEDEGWSVYQKMAK